MTVTFAQVRTPDTEDQALASALDTLTTLGFDITSWESGGLQMSMLRLWAKGWSKITGYIALLSTLNFNSLSSGDALVALSDDWYDNQQAAAVKAQYTEQLTNAGGVPYTVTIGELIFESSSVPGRTFRNITGGTLAASGGTLNVTIEDETAGVVGNVPNGDIVTMQTPLAGVTATNTARTQDGANAEADSSLQERNRTKWATLAATGMTDAYKNWARASNSAITRVKVDDNNPGGAGTVYVYVAGSDGAAGSTPVSDAQVYIDTKRPLGAIPTVFDATEAAIPLTFVAYVQAAYNTAATTTAIADALAAYINSLDIGGTVLPSGPNGIVSIDRLRRAVLDVEGVVDVTFTAPAADTTLAATEVATVGTVTSTLTSI